MAARRKPAKAIKAGEFFTEAELFTAAMHDIANWKHHQMGLNPNMVTWGEKLEWALKHAAQACARMRAALDGTQGRG